MTSSDQPLSPAPGERRRAARMLGCGIGVLCVVFLGQTWPHWRDDSLLAGTHADGPFHYYNELARLSPAHFPDDLAVQSNRQLGFYEFFYGMMTGLARASGGSLFAANLAVCWAANALYLAGILFLLKRLGLSPGGAALGTLLAAQPFVLISMSSGVVHSLAIPREVWLWPAPWFLAWFSFGRRQGARLLLFYAVLGAVYGFTYPLWAALLGLAFGLVDASRIVNARQWTELPWLGGAAAVCMALVVAPSLATFRAVQGEESAVLDYNVITRSVFWTKGFRRLTLFAGLGFGAFWLLQHRTQSFTEPLRRQRQLLVAALGVCLFYEPIQRLAPVVSLLYPGRLSLLAFLICMIAVSVALFRCFRPWPTWGKALAVVGVAALCLDPQRSLLKTVRQPPLPLQPGYVEFSRKVRDATPVEALFVVPPGVGSHYFRVYAERGLWIDPKDTGVLSRSRTTYDLAKERLAVLNEFFDKATPANRHEAILGRLQAEGVDHVVTRAEAGWARELLWPVLFSHAGWELRGPRQPGREPKPVQSP